MTPSPVVARIEDFEPGQHASFRKTFTDEDVRRFIEITGDTNPLHVDDDFAAKTQFDRRVIHGMLAASLFSTMVGRRGSVVACGISVRASLGVEMPLLFAERLQARGQLHTSGLTSALRKGGAS